MEKANNSFQVEINMKDNIMKVNQMVGVFMCGRMVINMRDSLRMVFIMVMEL